MSMMCSVTRKQLLKMIMNHKVVPFIRWLRSSYIVSLFSVERQAASKEVLSWFHHKCSLQHTSSDSSQSMLDEGRQYDALPPQPRWRCPMGEGEEHQTSGSQSRFIQIMFIWSNQNVKYVLDCSMCEIYKALKVTKDERGWMTFPGRLAVKSN